MTHDLTLLPDNSTPWEYAESLVSADRRPLDPSILRKLWNPWTCPVEYLPYLAWGLGLEIWDDNWLEAKKREVISRIWELKRLKTTPEGIRQYMKLVESEPVRFHRPKDKMWWVQTLSPEKMAEVMARMPEIRVYYAENTPYGWRAVYVDGGREIEVKISGLAGAIDPTHIISIPRSDFMKSFYGVPRHPAFYVNSDANFYQVTVTPVHDGLNFALASGVAPIKVKPEYKADKQVAPVYKAWHYPTARNYSFYMPSDANKHLYKSFRFVHPERVGTDLGQPMSFWGWSKTGTALFTANISSRIPVKTIPDYAFNRWWKVGYWMPSDMRRLWETLETIQASQAARDELWVKLPHYRELLFSDKLWFDTFEFGDVEEIW